MRCCKTVHSLEGENPRSRRKTVTDAEALMELRITYTVTYLTSRTFPEIGNSECLEKFPPHVLQGNENSADSGKEKKNTNHQTVQTPEARGRAKGTPELMKEAPGKHRALDTDVLFFCRCCC